MKATEKVAQNVIPEYFFFTQTLETDVNQNKNVKEVRKNILKEINEIKKQ